MNLQRCSENWKWKRNATGIFYLDFLCMWLNIPKYKILMYLLHIYSILALALGSFKNSLTVE
jgi:hypothetical protein